MYSSLVGDSARIYYLPSATYTAARGLSAAIFMKYIMGEYIRYGPGAYSYSSIAQVRKAGRASSYSPGLLLETNCITGGSRQSGYLPHHYATADSSRSVFLENLQTINNYVKMANNIVTRYGTINQEVFKYSWLDEVILDRQLVRPVINSHVYVRNE